MTIPRPGLSRQRWDVVQLGDLTLPPNPRYGVASLELTRSIKDDDKGGAGRPAAKQTTIEIAAAEGTLTLRFAERIWPLVEPIVRALQPGTGPYPVNHPNADLYKVASLKITGIEKALSWDAYRIGSFSLRVKEVPLAPNASSTLLLKQRKTDATVAKETDGKGPREVSRWQEFLVSRGPAIGDLLKPEGVDGIFGPHTAASTRAFQAAEGALVDGIVGPETFGEAAKYGYAPPPPSKALGAGSTSTAGAAKDKTGEWGDGPVQIGISTVGVENGPPFNDRGTPRGPHAENGEVPYTENGALDGSDDP